ncbi:MAG: ChrR family anti-sigma-E factor [Pseudomonadota bacterium]
MDDEKGQMMDAVIAEYVAGGMALPAQVLVESHLELVPENKAWAGELEALAGAELDSVEPVALGDMSSMLDAIMESPASEPVTSVKNGVEAASASDDILPKPLRDFIGYTVDSIPWRTKIPGVKVFNIEDPEGCSVSLLKIRPGMAMPDHSHEGRELTLVLKGAFSDVSGRYQRGDVSVAEEGEDHKPVADYGEDCICFIVADAPMRFTNRFTRIVNSILPS